MTAHAMAGDHEKSLHAGMNDHVTKPIDPQQLFSTLLKWIPAHDGAAGQRGSESVVEPAVEPSKRAPVSTPEDILPNAFPAFDLAEGLSRLQDNRHFYRKLLLNFADGYAHIDAEIKKALDSADWDQAHSLVHTIKGMAGNLAAKDLQAASIALEKLVKNVPAENPPSPADLKAKFSTFQLALHQSIEAVQTHISAEAEKTPETAAAGPFKPDPELAKQAAAKLRDAAEIGDVGGLVAIADEFMARSDGFAPYRDRIARLAEDFDFDGIIQLADELEISPSSIRFYEEKGLINPHRTAGNQRVYLKKHRARLKMILRGKRFGFSLDEIGEMIGMENVQMHEIEQIDRSQMFFDKKIEEVRNRRAELDFMEKDLLSFKQKLDRRRKELETMENKKLRSA
jgi:DNA-binding transcriptional MerR regulator/HPt (histidine-containing phosphotransfer) domain-containing protein